jgi:Fe-S cluster assembly iron-binding protein IscA
MVQISEAASELLLSTLVDASITTETGYRLAQADDGFRLRLDRPSEDDRVVRKEGHVVLMVDPGMDNVLDKARLDVVENQRRLKLVMP